MKRWFARHPNLMAVMLLGCVTVFPVLSLLYFALHDINGSSIGVWSARFTLNNFTSWVDSTTIQCAFRTCEYAVISVGTEIVVGTAIALFVGLRARKITPLVRVLSIPIMTSPLAVGMIWKLLFSTEGGWVNGALYSMFNIEVPWLSLRTPHWFGGGATLLQWTNVNWGFFVLIAADVWQWTPLVILVVLARLITVPQSLIEAASVDGLTDAKIARVVLLPLLRPTIVVLILLRLIDSFRVFENIWALFGDNDSAASMTSLIVKYTLLIRDYGRGAALSLFFLAMVIGCLVMFLRGAARRYQL